MLPTEAEFLRRPRLPPRPSELCRIVALFMIDYLLSTRIVSFCNVHSAIFTSTEHLASFV